jgi:Icc-related predicted phosphoesterase
MRILHISDTHGLHHDLKLNLDVDVIVHSGDCSNYRDPARNQLEVYNFLEWYMTLPAIKIFVAGNHDTSVERRMFKKEDFAARGIIYLEHDEVIIQGFKFFGSPYTPTFGDWAFMKARDKIYKVWESMPEDINVLITHGPPKGVRDLTENREGRELVQCGDLSLSKWVFNNQPNAHLFGHVHNMKGIKNQGISLYDKCRTVFSNASCVEDGKYNITSHGNIIEIKGD